MYGLGKLWEETREGDEWKEERGKENLSKEETGELSLKGGREILSEYGGKYLDGRKIGFLRNVSGGLRSAHLRLNHNS